MRLWVQSWGKIFSISEPLKLENIFPIPKIQIETVIGYQLQASKSETMERKN